MVSNTDSIIGLTTQTIQTEAKASPASPFSIQVSVAADKTSVTAQAEQTVKLMFGPFVGLATMPISAQAKASVVGNPRYLDQIDALYRPKSSQLALPEKALIDHGLKWWPSKQYLSTFAEIGASSQWRLEVTSLVRAEALFPAEEVPFAVLLTLEDPDGKAPVFRELRQHLQTSKANAQDVRMAVRLRT